MNEYNVEEVELNLLSELSKELTKEELFGFIGWLTQKVLNKNFNQMTFVDANNFSDKFNLAIKIANDATSDNIRLQFVKNFLNLNHYQY